MYICNNALSLTIANFCPNLKNIFVNFKDDELNMLKTILFSCQCSEIIQTLCGEGYLDKEVLETIVNYSNNFRELKKYIIFQYQQ